MCGISGIVSNSRFTDQVVTQVTMMSNALRHRGPDDAGIEVVQREGSTVVFGHRRLAIIDVSPAGHQPMLDPESGNWITFNGEIYNYRDLREALTNEGLSFRTQSDTEVILKAYALWGTSCVQYLRGIFAFAISDRNNDRVVLARDPVGVKPLYYAENGGTLIFASEVRSILASKLVKPSLDANGLNSYLAYGSVQEPFTLIRGIKSLPAGHTLVWVNGCSRSQRYWNTPEASEVSQDPPQDLYERVYDQLDEAVSMQLVSDVPIGVFLSGGVDSTVIAAIAQRHRKDPIRTLSLVFDEALYDESKYSRLASRHSGTLHTELRLTGEMVRNELPHALSCFDQPSMDGLNTFFVSKLAHENGLTVALSGVGGDELFAGYNGYRKALSAEKLGRWLALLPKPVRQLLSQGIATVAQSESLRKMSELLLSPTCSYPVTRQLFSTSQIACLLQTPVLETSREWLTDSILKYSSGLAALHDPVNRVSILEFHNYMTSTLLRDADQMSMAHSLEIRVPLADPQLARYLFTIPGSAKLLPGTAKPLMTRSADIPSECIDRSKRGFELPLNVWLRQGLRDKVRSLLTKPTGEFQRLFRKDSLSKIWTQFEKGHLGWSRVWALYVLHTWMETNNVTLSAN